MNRKLLVATAKVLLVPGSKVWASMRTVGSPASLAADKDLVQTDSEAWRRLRPRSRYILQVGERGTAVRYSLRQPRQAGRIQGARTVAAACPDGDGRGMAGEHSKRADSQTLDQQSPEGAVCLRFEDVALADRKGSGAKMTQAAGNFE